MKYINAAVRKSFLASFIFTVAFIAGIPATVLGAVFNVWAVMGIGIACVIIGFYAMPICWIRHAHMKSLKRLVFAVVEEHIYTVNGLGRQLSLSEKQVRNCLDECFRKSYIIGYLREGDNLILNEKKEPAQKKYAAECPYCGAKFTYNADNAVCPYCKSPVITDNDR